MGYSPRSTSDATVLAAPSPTPTYLCFDVAAYPNDAKMTAFWRGTGTGTPFYFTGFYLAPSPGHKDTGWMSKKEFLAGLGYGFLVIYFGEQAHNLTYEKGQADADNAVDLAVKEYFYVAKRPATMSLSKAKRVVDFLFRHAHREKRVEIGFSVGDSWGSLCVSAPSTQQSATA